ncbi:hypothetical protein ABPG77_005297 [Micractinium sp. CCAP 211/92]
MLTLDVLAAAQRRQDPHAAALVPVVRKLVWLEVQELTGPAPPTTDSGRVLAAMQSDADCLERMAAMAGRGTLAMRKHGDLFFTTWQILLRNMGRLWGLRPTNAERSAVQRLHANAHATVSRFQDLYLRTIGYGSG